MRPCWLLAAGVFVQGCLLDGATKQRLGTTPASLNDGWSIATPEDVGLDRAQLDAIHEQLLRPDAWFGALGFLVVKDQKLVYETYLRSDADRDSVHHIQSATKSVTSLAWGIASDRGLTPPLGTLICDILDCSDVDSSRRAITLEDLFTMRSGLDFDNSVFSVEMWIDKPADPIRYILDKPLTATPGATFDYEDCNPQLVGYALQSLVGESEEQFTRDSLFAALGIDDFIWDSGPDGVSMAAHGLHLKPRDLAKIGEVLLEGGAWMGSRIVSQAWMGPATTPQTATTYENLSYGYYFWLDPAEGAESAWGHGGQFTLAIPSKGLLLVLVSLPDADLQGGMLPDFLALTESLRQSL